MSARSTAVRRATSLMGSAMAGAQSISPMDLVSSSVQVVSPASHGSLGDEALVLGSLAAGESSGVRTSLLTPGDVTPWQRLGVASDSLDTHESRGGFQWRGVYPSPITAEKLVVLGADSIDGVYGLRSVALRINLLNTHARVGGQAFLANFSLSERSAPDAVRLLKRLSSRVHLSARDEDSRRRAEELFRRSVHSAPDVAQYLHPVATERTRELEDRATAWREGGRDVVVVVPNAHFGALYGNRDKLRDGFVSIVTELQERGRAVIVLAHDLREDPGDPGLSRSVAHGANAVSFIPTTTAEAKYVVGLADAVVTGRMHAAVAALSQDVPCIGLDYVGKFSGQFRWYGEDDHVLPWSAVMRPHEAVDALERRLTLEPEPSASRVRAFVPSWLV